MKKIIIFLLIALPFLTKAQLMPDLIVYSTDGQNFTLYLDNAKQNNAFTNKVIVSDIPAGYHTITAVFQNTSISPISGQITVQNASVNVIAFERLGNGYNIVPKGFILYSQSTKPYIYPVPPTPKPQEIQPEDNTDNCIPVDNPTFNSLYNTVKKQSFESTKLNVAKQIVSSNCLTSSQIKQIALLFDFDSDKLTFAKYAYQYVYDPQNYYLLYDVFDFDTSKNQLSNYINQQK